MNKNSIALTLALGLTLTGGLLLPAGAAPNIAADPAKIAAVKAKTLTTAHASWWGFNAEDSTEALQNAINSGVSRLIVDNIGADWVVSKPIELASNQEIIFAENVVVQAKKGTFLGTNDCLLIGRNVQKSTLTGHKGATLRMQRDDYANPKLYKKAEWRHGISYIDSRNVIVRGLTVRETGGDGLYLGASRNGYNKNVLVEDMNFDANYRLGMAVISVEDLVIRRCKFNNTKGTGPDGGIDFEPNYPEQRLVNCVVEESEFENNFAGGFDIYLVFMNKTSLPVSITLKNSRFKGNLQGVVSTISKEVDKAVDGTIEISDCRFDNNGITLNPPARGARHIIKDCTFDYVTNTPATQRGGSRKSPLIIKGDVHSKEVLLGNVSFTNNLLRLKPEMAPIEVTFQTNMNLEDTITGALTVEKNGAKTAFDIDKFIGEQQKFLAVLNATKSARVDITTLKVPEKDAPVESDARYYLQGKFTFLQYARQGQDITVNVRAKRVYDRLTEVELQDPQGNVIQKYTVPLDGTVLPISFTATQTGLYRVVRNSTFSQQLDVSSPHRGNGLLIDGKLLTLPGNGRLYFEVPRSVKEVKIGVSTDSNADISLLDAQGKVQQKMDKLNGFGLLQASRANTSQSEIWSLQVNNAVWLVTLAPYEPLIPIFSTNPATMLRVP